MFPAIEKLLAEGGILLDVGCGNADLLNIAEKHNYNYFGIDISGDMIKRAEKSYPNGNFTESSSNNFS